MFVINDTIFASCGYQGLYIFTYDESTNRFTQRGSLTNYTREEATTTAASFPTTGPPCT